MDAQVLGPHASSNSVSSLIKASRILLLASFTMRAKFGACASVGASAFQMASNKDVASLLMPYDENSTVRKRDKNLCSKRSVPLQVKIKIVLGGKSVASSFESSATCAAS